MYFASASARTTALTGVLVEGMVSYIPTNGIEYYNGSAWVSISQAVTALTTKGDLLTYSTQDTRLPVGSDGQTLVANSAATTGLQWQTPVQQNPILNSAMQVWQRSTSIGSITTAVTYTADRWCALAGATTTTTVSRQATSDTTNLPNIQYCARVQRNSGQTGTSAISLSQSLESVNSIPFMGKVVTLSFYARAGANYSAASSILTANMVTGTGTDQNILSTYTGTAYPINQNVTLTTTWQRFTITTSALSSSATELAMYFSYTPVGTAGANDYYEITGVQLEVGSVATPFHTFSTTLQSELAACQRYYWRTTSPGSAPTLVVPAAWAYSAVESDATIAFPVSMRTAPTSVDYANLVFSRYDNTGYNITSVTLATNTASSYGALIYGTVVAATAGNVGKWMTQSIAGNNYLGFSAEL
jgi:hypothetical protein